MMIQQQYVRGTRWFGDYCYCCCCSLALLPAGTRIYLTYDTMIMDFSSPRPFHCFLPSIYTNPLHTRSTSYLQYYENIENHTTPYPLAVICRFYGPSPLRLLPVLRACAEPQAGVSPPRRSPPGTVCTINVMMLIKYYSVQRGCSARGSQWRFSTAGATAEHIASVYPFLLQSNWPGL